MALLASLRLNRSMSVLLAGILLFHAGWYMLLPFFAILFTTRRNFSPTEVGLVLAAQSFTLLIGSLAGGTLADRLGRKTTLILGLVFRATGVGALGLAASVPSALAAVAVAGFGGGLYGPAAKAAIAMLTTDENRTQSFALRGIAANIGTSGGPLLGALLVGGSMQLLFGAAAAVHLGLGGLTWAMLKEEGKQAEQPKGAWRELLADQPFLLFSLVTVLAWALFSQLAISVPLFAGKVLGLEASIGLLWTITSLAVILFQFAVTRFAVARLHPMMAMAAGTALMGLGLGLVGLTRTFPTLVGALLVFILGEMLILPTADSTVSLMARAGAVGSYFGIASFAWGLGEGLGSLAGGALMQFSLSTGRMMVPWSVYAAAGLVIAGGYMALRRWPRLQRQLEQTTPETAAKVRLFRPGHPAPNDGLRLGGSVASREDEE